MKNEPIKFADGKVIIGLSTVADGDIRTVGKAGAVLAKVRQNRDEFLYRVGFAPEQTALVMLDYDSQDFTRYTVIDTKNAGQGIVPDRKVDVADALVTREKELGMFLPLADCLGAVIYDPEREALMVSHLGRHNLEQSGGEKSIEFLVREFGTQPKNLVVWLSPSAGKENYPLFSFDNKSIREVAVEQLTKAGVNPDNIFGEDIDTTVDDNYYSHSVAQRTGKDLNKRFAIVAKMV